MMFLLLTTLLLGCATAQPQPTPTFTPKSFSCGLLGQITKNTVPVSCTMILSFDSSTDQNNADNLPAGFEVVSDGCTHYSDASCPSKAGLITRTCEQTTSMTCTYTFSWTSPPALGGNQFTVYVLWRKVQDYVVAKTGVVTSSARSTGPAWVLAVVAMVVAMLV